MTTRRGSYAKHADEFPEAVFKRALRQLDEPIPSDPPADLAALQETVREINAAHFALEVSDYRTICDTCGGYFDGTIRVSIGGYKFQCHDECPTTTSYVSHFRICKPCSREIVAAWGLLADVKGAA